MKTLSLLGGFLLLFVGIAPVWACSIPTPPPDWTPPPVLTLEDYAHNAPVIFVGTATHAVEYNGWGSRVEIQVERYLKGSGFNIVQMDGYFIDCFPYIPFGTAFIFFADEHMNSAGVPVYFRIWEAPMTGEYIESVRAITGQMIPAQALPLDLQVARIAEQTDISWLFILCAGLALVTSIGLAWKWRSHRRKPKQKREEML